ncbi:MAG TPA: adenylate/guanylate cyclase domain-containing protein [Candidatus Binatia bacterium]|nr:adenylate/guanylate cyclase domain-containing protein [Candidatus Binatia bacterium]
MDVPETRYARSKEGNVAYQIVGDGPRDLVFIPWWATNVEIMWEEPSIARFLNRLASFTRLLCFDKRGAGVSDPVPLAALPTLEQWSDDIRTVMEAAGSQRAALLGHSHGGQMAMLFAATYPGQTSALILVDAFARQFGDDDRPWAFSLDRAPLSLDEIEELWGTGINLDVFAPSAAHDERFRRWYARYERLSLSPRMVRAVVASDFEKDLRGILPAIRVPTLVLHRAANRFIDVRQGRYLAEHIPGAKFVEVPGGDHLFHLGETETMLGEIEEFLTGERPVPETDRVLATVLFTDIVGSTERAAALGDHAWRSLLDAHHDVARRELERHRGRAVEFVGDGLLATFDGPARAIRCACAIAEGVRALGIEIRAGLHTGEIELAGRAIRGIAVHIGARVAAEAGPGEVLVSSTVKDLVAGSGLRFVDRGLRVLKGVPDEWRLFLVNPRAV